MEKKRSYYRLKFLGIFLLVSSLLAALGSTAALASNVEVKAVKIKNLSPFTRTAQIEFSLSQQAPYTRDILGAKDYIWVFGKYAFEGEDTSPSGWHHLELENQRKGLLIPALAAAEEGKTFVFTWDFSDDAELFDRLSQGKRPRVRICAIEMVRIPAASGGESFYLAKYEVSQGQFADYLNLLSAQEREEYVVKNPVKGYSISYTARSPEGEYFKAAFPERACNFISFEGARNYAEWAGLRLPQEAEWMRAARGPDELGGKENQRAYPWGDTDPQGDSVNAVYQEGEARGHYEYYANFGNLKEGQKPLTVGFYGMGDIARSIAQTGISPFGIPDLAGNLAEWVMNSGSDFGLKGGSFTSNAEEIKISAVKQKLAADQKSASAGCRLAK